MNTLCGQNVELLNVKPNTFEQRLLNPQFTGNMLLWHSVMLPAETLEIIKKKGLLSLSLAKPR